MKRTRLLSIIVPVYNVENYLNKCIESILLQTYKNIEVILVDDGSTDLSGKICDKYKRKDKRVKVIHKANEGLVKARKTGIEYASGEVVAYVDGDDWIEMDMYSSMIEHMDDNVDVVTSGLIYEWKDHERRKIVKDGLKTGFYNRNEIEKVLNDVIYCRKSRVQNITTSVCNKMFRLEPLKKAMEFVDDGLTYGEDGALVCSFLFFAKGIFVTSIAKYHYLQHNSSMINQYGMDSFNQIYKLQQCILRSAKENIPAIDFSQQVEYYVSAFLEGAERAIYKIKTLPLHYIFPYESVKKNSRVVLYGAGTVGQSYYKCIQDESYVKLEMWVDRKWKEKGSMLSDPQELFTAQFDYIVIAIEDIDVANDVIEMLKERKISGEKIVWKKPYYIR